LDASQNEKEITKLSYANKHGNNKKQDKKIQIETKNLNLYYGEDKVIKDVSFNIYERTVTALIGPSGCGKTSYLRCLNRMNDFIQEAMVDGEILINGKNIYDKATDVIELRRKVGMVFQKPNPFPMSIYENVAYAPRLFGIKDREKLDEIVKSSLEGAALWDEVDGKLKTPGTSLSGGQQQRLCIARAIATEPDILLMDEPTSALDPLSTLRIEELIRELKKKFTVVIVTHNMQQAARISDYTAFFLLGDLVEYNNTNKMFTSPEDQRTEDYITGKFG
jgi:phosphate transport system ATP-binding protein